MSTQTCKMLLVKAEGCSPAVLVALVSVVCSVSVTQWHQWECQAMFKCQPCPIVLLWSYALSPTWLQESSVNPVGCICMGVQCHWIAFVVLPSEEGWWMAFNTLHSTKLWDAVPLSQTRLQITWYWSTSNNEHLSSGPYNWCGLPSLHVTYCL